MGDLPTNDEIREAYEAATAAGLGMTRSRQRAEELVQDAFEAVMTTRPWSRSAHTFKHHMVGIVWSLASHEHTSKRPKRDAAAHAGWQREQAGERAPSPEERTLHRAEEENKQTSAEAELDALDASLGDNEIARRVLRCRREHGLVKARDIATKLDLPVEPIYRANETLKGRLRTLRRRRDEKDEDE